MTHAQLLRAEFPQIAEDMRKYVASYFDGHLTVHEDIKSAEDEALDRVNRLTEAIHAATESLESLEAWNSLLEDVKINGPVMLHFGVERGDWPANPRDLDVSDKTVLEVESMKVDQLRKSIDRLEREKASRC